MLKIFLKLAFRRIKRQIFYTVINVTGLAIGISAAVLILLWVHDEQSFDSFHEGAENIYRVYQVSSFDDRYLETASTPGLLSLTIRDRCPELEYVSCVRGYQGEKLVTVGERMYNEKGLGFADEYFFRLFSFPVLSGDKVTALKDPFSVAISESTAARYFGNVSAIGRTINILGSDFEVTAVFGDMPGQSHMHFDILGSFSSFDSFRSPGTWGVNTFKTYVRLSKGTSVETINRKMEGIVKDHLFASNEQYETVIAAGNYKKFLLQPLSAIHLDSHLYFEFETNGNKTYVTFFKVIALFILLIAVINYLNLSTAGSGDKVRETGLRKILGSSRTLLISQFLAESVALTIIAFIISMTAISLLLPYFSGLVGKPWMIDSFASKPFLLPVIAILAILTGLVAGLYPALILSSFKPVLALNSNKGSGFSGAAFRSGLVVFQFFITVVLLIMTVVVSKQMAYIEDSDPGFEPEDVVVVKTFGQAESKLKLLKELMLQNKNVLSVSASSALPGTVFTNVGMGLESTRSNTGINLFITDADFPETMGINILEGRYFDANRASDKYAVVINRSFEKFLGEDELIGKRLRIWVGGDKDEMFDIIGVINDFNYESFHEPVKPLAIVMLGGLCQWSEAYLSVKVNGDSATPIGDIQGCLEKIIPGMPFDYTFLDSVNNNQYRQETLMKTLFMFFTFFMICVACLGLLGLTSFAAGRRRKEIAVRKVIGATENRLFLMLSGGFIRWAALASLIAWPVAWLIMSRWLEQFSFRTKIGLWPFVFSLLLILAITGITVFFHTYRASVSNPVTSLRSE